MAEKGGRQVGAHAAWEHARAHQPLRDDIKLLGDLLGQVIAEREGDATFERVEELRQRCKRQRARPTADGDRRLRAWFDAIMPSRSCVQEMSTRLPTSREAAGSATSDTRARVGMRISRKEVQKWRRGTSWEPS